MLQCSGVFCSFLQCTARGRVYVDVAVFCSVLQCLALRKSPQLWRACTFMMHCVAVCCSVLQCAPTMANHGRVYVHVAVCCGVLQFFSVSCSTQITPTMATRLRLCVLSFAQPLAFLLSLSLSCALFSRALSFYICISCCLSRARALFLSLSLSRARSLSCARACSLPCVRVCAFLQE